MNYMNQVPHKGRKLPPAGILRSIVCMFLGLVLPAYAQQNLPEFNFDSKTRDDLRWLVTGKGSKPAKSTLPTPQEVRRGVYDPEFIGSPYTELNFTKGWYTPHEEWTPEMQLDVFNQARQLKKDRDVEESISAASTSWSQKGPFGMEVLGSSPTVHFAGRVTSIDFNDQTGLHLTTGTGGLWGRPVLFIMLPLADQQPTLIAGAVAVHPTNPDMIFYGTGEYNRRAGTGAYRTTNGGATWMQMSLSATPSGVQRILIAPYNSSLVFIACDAGIYRSTNNGDAWSRVATWNCSDIASSPFGSVMLAGRYGTGVYRSTDQGQTWTQLTSGLPSSNVERVSLVICPSDFGRAYVQISRADNDAILGVYRSDNDNATTPGWTNITPSASYMPNQGWVHNAIGVHPTNENLVWVGGVNLLRSTNSGSSWTEQGTNTGQVHGDIHVIFYRNFDHLLYVGSDGGVFTSDDDGSNWSSEVNTVLPVTQFYNIGVPSTNHAFKYGGAQDNGISGTMTGGISDWIYSLGGDGVDASVDRSNTSRLYITNGVYGGAIAWKRKKSTNSGSSWSEINSGINESTPWASIYIEQDPSSSSWFYSNAGSYFYYTSNSGGSWNRTNTSALSGNAKHVTVNSNGTFVYGCTDNTSQRLMGYTYVGGGSPWSQSNISSGLPSKEVKRVSTSLTNSSRAYALMTGTGDDQKIYKTTDKGSSWTNITSDLPTNVPVTDLVENPNNSSVLYLATQAGAYKSANGGAGWYRWNSSMPEGCWINDLEYAFSGSGDYLVAGTFGRSTFERKATGLDAIFSISAAVLNFGSIINHISQVESLYVRNIGEAPLTIQSVRSNNSSFYIYPTNDIVIRPADSVWFYVYFYSQGGGDSVRKIGSEIEFVHDGDGSPSTVGLLAYLGDGTMFRSFSPESLIVKKAVKRKGIFTSWCFDFPNTAQPGDVAVTLDVVFKNPVTAFGSYEPFRNARRVDEKGLEWHFGEGSVAYGGSLHLCGQTKKKTQQVMRWSWSVFNETRGPLIDQHGPMTASMLIPGGLGMPNAANFRQEIFGQAPFNKDRPLVVGVPDPNARAKKVAYVGLAKQGDLLGSLMPGRSGKTHSGPPRCFDLFDNRKEMIGLIKKLTPDMQSNSLFAELVALKLNIYGSALGKTPPGFGELRYVNANSSYNGLLVRQLDSLADRYMTDCDNQLVSNPNDLYAVVHDINRAFEGPLDTIRFVRKLEFTGVRPVAEVSFLERDPSIAPTRIVPAVSLEAGVPALIRLSQNYPNPFNPATTIEFELPEPAIVTLKVYNVLGQEVATLLDREARDGGAASVEFDPQHLPSGAYFYRIVAEEPGDPEEGSVGRTQIAVKKMMLVR